MGHQDRFDRILTFRKMRQLASPSGSREPLVRFPKRLSRRSVQRVVNFVYGACATLGLLGLASYF